MRAIDADELKIAFPPGEYVRTECVRATIDNMSTIEPERKKGKWILSKSLDDGFWVCSSCRFVSEASGANILYKFCPNCGCSMGNE